MRLRLSIFVVVLSSLLLSCSAPQLGKDPLASVIKAMTVEEKVQLVVGTCKDWNLVPPAAPNTNQRPAPPADYWETYQGNTATMKGKVSGAAGVSYAIPRLGIPSIVLADGPVGLRIDSVCTAFPSTALLAATRDTLLVKRVGAAIAQEMLYYGVDILLAPGINIMRNPLCGRNYEYMSSEAEIAGNIAAAYVQGVQSQGVGACIKHFAVNNQETYRNGIDVQLDDTLLRNLYLKPFEIVVKHAQPWTVMSAYNKVNGVYAAENKYLLTDILRNEWGFDGFVMTDWWAEEDPIRMQIAGNDMLMPGTQLQIDTLIAAVKDGRLDEKILDCNVENILRIIMRSPSFLQPNRSSNVRIDSLLHAHAQIARKVAGRGMVLLKNEGVLPLRERKITSVALLGKGSYDTYVGGTGSGRVTRAYKVNLDEALLTAGFRLDTALMRRYKQHIAHSRSVQQQESAWFMPYVSEQSPTQAQIEQLAQTNDMAIVTIQRIAGEGGDRQLVAGDYYLTQDEKIMIERVSKAFRAKEKKVILVLNIGATMEITDLVDKVDAILLAWLPGQEAGNAIVDVLTGVTLPIGKLPMPFYYAYEDVPSATNFPMSDGNPSKVCYREGRQQPKRTLYPVGYGLTYEQ